MILRNGKTPRGLEVPMILKHGITRIRHNWPEIDILVRGNSHYGRPQTIAWCEARGSMTSSACPATTC